MSPTQRTLAELRKQGYRAGIVERWLRYAGTFGKRQDLFGIIDIIAISPYITLGVQCCSTGMQEHWNKLTVEKNQESYDWLQSPDRKLQIWGWRKLRKKGLIKSGAKKKGHYWEPRIFHVTLESLDI